MQLGWLSGSLGLVKVYSRALSADEVAGLYDENAARFSESLCSVSTCPAVVVGSPTRQPGCLATSRTCQCALALKRHQADPPTFTHPHPSFCLPAEP